MITAETIRRCSSLDAITLENYLRKLYPEDRVLRSEFLGITNSGSFVYEIVYPDQDGDMGMVVTKIFVREKRNGEIVVEY